MAEVAAARPGKVVVITDLDGKQLLNSRQPFGSVPPFAITKSVGSGELFVPAYETKS